VTEGGTLARVRGVLSFRDFRQLVWLRLATQLGDGFFQAVLVGSVVFSPTKQSTTVGFAKALAILVIPYSSIGPFAGVFIDRWPRKLILVATPLVRGVLAFLVIGGTSPAVPFYAGALLVLSGNRFLLTTASSIVPRLVPSRDLLMANSVTTVSGTFTRFVGVAIGGPVVDAVGYPPVIVATAAAWAATAFFAARIRSDLSPERPAAAGIVEDVARVARDLRDGARRLIHTPRALAPITSVTWNQFLNGLMLVMSLVVFRDRFHKGVGSFSSVVAAGGAGVLLGLVTIGSLEGRFQRRTIMAGSFVLSGIPLVLVAGVINRYDVLMASFLLGLAFAWLKVPADTMTQEATPDRYRGRVFAIYDIAQNMSGVVSALLAIALVKTISVEWLVAAVGVLFLAGTPWILRWLRPTADVTVRSYSGSRADETPRSVVFGGEELEVDVERSWREERAGSRLLCFRLRLPDGTRIEVSRTEDGGPWRLDREIAS
jgi:MFS family permease